MTFAHVRLVSHADWSKDPQKCWMAVAILHLEGRWLVNELTKITDPSGLFTHLKSLSPVPGCILSGFDFPIGLPSAYASQVGISGFLDALPLFGNNEWGHFYHPAETPLEISPYRPFYPAKPGSSKRLYLEIGLSLHFNDLYRLCEMAHKNRRAACPLFWTMGGQQVGKAAISGWKSLLAPAFVDPGLNLKIWPFSGSLDDVCQPGNLVVVETYPAEFYSHLGLSFIAGGRKSKRRQSDRIALAGQLISWAKDNHIDLAPPIIEQLHDGFGSALDGEDRFDALVGLYGMINIIEGNHPSGEPVPPHVARIEGWIFGQEQPG